jgi:hypothetical protein
VNEARVSLVLSERHARPPGRIQQGAGADQDAAAATKRTDYSGFRSTIARCRHGMVDQRYELLKDQQMRGAITA